MSHWAELDDNNQVIRVIVGDNNTSDEGESFVNLLGGVWVKTSYNNNIRGVYAGVGYSYNAQEDIFVTPQPYPSWTRNGSFWDAPIAMPDDNKFYNWDEEVGAWVEAEII
jgi:hypothetical protein